MDVPISFEPEVLNNQIISLLPPATNHAITTTDDTNSVQASHFINVQSSFISENGETLTYAGEIQRNGQLFMIFQNDKGEKTEVLCETNIISMLPPANTDSVFLNVTSNNLEADTIDSSCNFATSNDQLLGHQVIGQNSSQEQILSISENENKSQISKIENMSSITIPIQQSTDLNIENIESTNNKSSIILNPQTSSNQSIPEPMKETADITNQFNQQNQSLIANNSVGLSTHQLSKSPKTYSRTSNIVWLDIPEKKDQTKSKLTTTIEIAESDDMGLSSIKRSNELSPSKLNKIQINSNNKLPDIFHKKIPENVKITLTKNPEIISINYSNNKKSSIDLPLNDVNKEKLVIDGNEKIEENDKFDQHKRPYVKRGTIKSITNTNLTENDKNKLVNNSPIEKFKKKVTFNENNNEFILQKNKHMSESFNYSTQKSFIESINSKFNFKQNDRRSKDDYCDIMLNNALKVSIRIQPDCRDERPLIQFYCENCDYKTRCFMTLKSHRNWCSIYHESTSKPTSLKFNQISSSSVKYESKTSTPINTEPLTVRKRKAQIENEIPYKVYNKNHTSLEREELFNSDIQTSDIESDLDENLEDEEYNEEMKILDGFSNKDVVWFETKKGFWPALITDILINEKKLLLRLINFSGKNASFKTNTSSVVSHESTMVNKFLKKHPKELKTVQKVEEYLRKRALGDNINPISFFFESIRLELPNSLDKLSKNDETLQNNSTKNISITIDGATIYQFIKEGNIDTHLRSIHNGTIENERHKFFEKEKDELEEKFCFGPIKDEDQQDDLFLYLSNLYEDCLKKSNEVKSLERIAPYIYVVWIPEAIIKAISKKYHVDMKKAEELFNKECSSTQNQYRNIE